MSIVKRVDVTGEERDQVMLLVEKLMHKMTQEEQEYILHECNYIRDLVIQRNPDGNKIAAIIIGMFNMMVLDVLNEVDRQRLKEIGRRN